MSPELEKALARQAALPPDRDGPTFRAPWHAQAFALAVELHGQGHVTWPEWAASLALALRDVPAAGGDPEDAYYAAWLTALERLCVGKGLLSETERRARAEAFAHAARTTPHGQPITLG